MPQQQLQLLNSDVQRLIAAGGNAAAGDEGLARRARALREHAAKIPALVPIADAVERVTTAAPKKASPALLDLLLVARQVRVSLAGPAAAAKPEPVPAVGPWATPTPARDVQRICDLFTTSGQDREETVRREAQNGTFTDLRLVGPLLDTLAGSTYHELTRLTATEILPRFGKALVPDLEHRLNLDGNQADARRLDVLTRIDADRGAALCRKALTEGSTAVKVQALRSLAEVAPREAEDAAYAILEPLLKQKKPNRDLLNAAYAALGQADSDRALETLLAALDRKLDWGGADEALQAIRHPQAVPQLVARLNQQAAEYERLSKDVEKLRKAKSRAKAAKQELAEKEEKLEMSSEPLNRLATILAMRGDPECLNVLFDLAKRRGDMRYIAGDALESCTGPRAVAALPDLLKRLDDKDATLRGYVISILERIGPPAAVAGKQLLALTRDKNASVRVAALNALGHIRPPDPEVIPTLIAALKDKAINTRCVAAQALGMFGPAAAAAVPALQDMLKGKSVGWWVKYSAEQALNSINAGAGSA